MKLTALFALLLMLAACGEGAPRLSPDTEAMALAAYPAIPAAEDSLALREAGERNFRNFGCAACHSTKRERQGLLGPPLGGTAERVLPRHNNDALESRRWLARHIHDPQKYPGPFKEDPAYRGGFMPANPRIDAQPMRELVEYLWLLP